MAIDDNKKIREDAAQNLSILLDKNPNKAFLWIRVLQEKGVNPEIYSLIAQNLKNEIVKNLVDKYHSNLIANNEDEYKLSLENSISETSNLIAIAVVFHFLLPLV